MSKWLYQWPSLVGSKATFNLNRSIEVRSWSFHVSSFWLSGAGDFFCDHYLLNMNYRDFNNMETFNLMRPWSCKTLDLGLIWVFDFKILLSRCCTNEMILNIRKWVLPLNNSSKNWNWDFVIAWTKTDSRVSAVVTVALNNHFLILFLYSKCLAKMYFKLEILCY